MSAVQNILQRIFKDKNVPTDASKEEFHAFFESAVNDFENSGFLEQTKIAPILTEADFQQKLFENRNKLMLVKYWKRNCIPCLSFAEMFKAAEKQCLDDKLPVVWYSVNIKEKPNKDLVDFQMVDGTPTIQKFFNFRQVGQEVQETRLGGLMKDITGTLKDLDLWRN